MYYLVLYALPLVVIGGLLSMIVVPLGHRRHYAIYSAKKILYGELQFGTDCTGSNKVTRSHKKGRW